MQSHVHCHVGLPKITAYVQLGFFMDAGCLKATQSCGTAYSSNDQQFKVPPSHPVPVIFDQLVSCLFSFGDDCVASVGVTPPRVGTCLGPAALSTSFCTCVVCHTHTLGEIDRGTSGHGNPKNVES